MMDLITAKEIADMLKLSQKHVADRVTHQADFPRPYRPGRSRRWERSDVKAWIESKKF